MLSSLKVEAGVGCPQKYEGDDGGLGPGRGGGGGGDGTRQMGEIYEWEKTRCVGSLMLALRGEVGGVKNSF